MDFLHYLVIVPILGFLMIAHEFGHFIVAKRSGIVVEVFSIGFPPRILAITRGGVKYTLGLIPLGAYVKMLGEEDPTDPGSFASQPKVIRALVLAAGSTMNLLAAILVFALAYGTGWPDPNNARVEVVGIAPGSPAEQAGLQDGDVIQTMNGQQVRSLDKFSHDTGQLLGQPIDLTVDRSGQQVSLTVTPRAHPPEGQGPIGIRLQSARGTPVPHGPLESLSFGVRQSFTVIGNTLAVPVMAIRGQLSPEAARPIGVPGMAQVAASATDATIKSGWWGPILAITGLISAGLAVANMLPLPALDGGRLVFVLIEAIRGRRVPPEREGVIHLVGMAVLVSLMVLISFHDLVQPPAGIDWGIR